jgi:hypothetical protein
MEKRRVYVAGKLSHDDAVGYLNNVHRMMETAEEANKAGYSTYVPAIDLLMGIKFGYKDYHQYFDNSQPWLMASDAVLLTPGWESSPGTKREMATARDLNIPIFETVDDMNKWFIDDDPSGMYKFAKSLWETV